MTSQFADLPDDDHYAAAEPVRLDEALPGDVAAVVADLVPGVHARRAGNPGHEWKMWGKPMYRLDDASGHYIGMCTRTVIWSTHGLADQVAERLGCPVKDSPYGRAALLSGRIAPASKKHGTVAGCGMEHAVNGACPTGLCD